MAFPQHALRLNPSRFEIDASGPMVAVLYFRAWEERKDVTHQCRKPRKKPDAVSAHCGRPSETAHPLSLRETGDAIDRWALVTEVSSLIEL